jgi:NADH:ubiquinone reductase (H+-translocating)
MAPRRIVILGGGYGALYSCPRLKRAARKGKVEVTLINKENFHIWHGFIGEMLVGKISPRSILTPARRVFQPAKIILAIVNHIDREKKLVSFIREHDGLPGTIPYDDLIINVGTRQSSESFPGLDEHGYKLKKWDHCFQLRNHIPRMFELASSTEDEDERRAMLTFFVAGGGFSGTEVAGSLASLAKKVIKKDYKELDVSEVRIILVHPGKTILPEFYGPRVNTNQAKQYPSLVKYAEKQLKKSGVELETETRILAVSPNSVTLDNGIVIPTRTVISAIGTSPQALVFGSDLPLTESQRLDCEPSGLVKGCTDIYAAGDCAAIPHPKGGEIPPTAWWAMKAGDHVAKNILRKMKGKKPKPFKLTGLGQAVSIGNNRACAELKGIPIKGFTAWVTWRLFLLYFFPSVDGKVRIISDWMISPLLGRDIIDMSVDDFDDFEIKRMRYQPGELIVEQGRVGNTYQLILSGQAIVSQDVDGDGVDDFVKTLGVGDLIGHDSSDGIAKYSVKSDDVLETVALRHDEAEDLARTFSILLKGEHSS